VGRAKANPADLKLGRKGEKVINSMLILANLNPNWHNEDGEDWGRDFSFWIDDTLIFWEVETRRVWKRKRNIRDLALTYGLHFRATTVDFCADLDVQTFYCFLWDDFINYHLASMELIQIYGKKIEKETERGKVEEFYELSHNNTYNGVTHRAWNQS
jgi:hypothetical protein